MQSLKIGLCGLGNVGGAVLRHLRSDRHPDVKLCAVAARRQRNHDLAGLSFSEQPLALVDDPNVDVVVELLGGIDDAAELVGAAIEKRKHVVTANKALLSSDHGERLLAAAASAGVQLRFEAAVAGGIPVIKLLREGLVANRVDAVGGILNGTSNFVLSERSRTKCRHEKAVKTAQACGYAERDPTLDVNGSDAADKLRILSRLAFSMELDVPLPLRQGIAELSERDFTVARELSCRLRPLAVAERSGQGLAMGVFVSLVPQWDSDFPTARLSAVEGADNAVLLQGDLVGSLLCCGAGAGAEPTASAVLADITELASGSRAPPLPPLDTALSQSVSPPLPRPQCLWCTASGANSKALCEQLETQLPAAIRLTAPFVIGDDIVMALLRSHSHEEAEALCSTVAQTLGEHFATLDLRCLPIEASEGKLQEWCKAHLRCAI